MIPLKRTSVNFICALRVHKELITLNYVPLEEIQLFPETVFNTMKNKGDIRGNKVSGTLCRYSSKNVKYK